MELAASFMVVQFHRLGSPLTNGILPLYEVPFAKFFKKVDPLYPLIQCLSRQLQLPVVSRGETLLVVQDQLNHELDYKELEKKGAKKIFLLGLTSNSP